MIEKLRGIVSQIKHRLAPYEPIEVSEETWNAEYASGHWDRLRQLDQLAHYSIVVGICKHFNVTKGILDVGCGDGVLLENLIPGDYGPYVGLDLSHEAIRKANILHGDTATFKVADAAAFDCDQEFDAIILNEVLYYIDDPLSVLRKYARFCTDEGILVISMHYTHRSQKLWKILLSQFEFADTTLMENMRGNQHKVGVLRVSDNLNRFDR